ncbi:hypothetical protein C5615_13045 [Burkholderia cepacia]|uniref:Uncharacterized protein n=1 Tax=Burkholderia cepacia TaxID=292 RepID=A0A2S8IVL8_BURCE|nr:hypothetical protein C5615_13045 [Burkholderia cepacia]
MKSDDCIDRIMYRIDASMHAGCAPVHSCCISQVRRLARSGRFRSDPDWVMQGSDRRQRHLSTE